MTEIIGPQNFSGVLNVLEVPLGRIVLLTGQIEHLLVVTLRRTTSRDWRDVFDASIGKDGKARRKEAKKCFEEWAREKFDADVASNRITEFNAVVDRIGRLSKARNLALHSAWGVDADGRVCATNRGNALFNDADNPFSVDDVRAVAEQLYVCVYLLNAATNPNLVSPMPVRGELGSIIVPDAEAISFSASAVTFRADTASVFASGVGAPDKSTE